MEKKFTAQVKEWFAAAECMNKTPHAQKVWERMKDNYDPKQLTKTELMHRLAKTYDGNESLASLGLGSISFETLLPDLDSEAIKKLNLSHSTTINEFVKKMMERLS